MSKITVIIIVVIIFAAGFFLFSKPARSPQVTQLPDGIILFYGDGCSHCKIVDDYITQNKIEEKLEFTRMEVWYNQNNQMLLGKAAEKCGISADTVGVPFLYDGSNCYIGQDEAINFLKNAAKIQ